MKEQTSTIFVNNITQIDFAFIDENGKVIGNSVNLNGTLTGPLDEEEQVVIDFSACKKQIKALIDDDPKGIDHKLVILERSDNEFSVQTEDGEYVATECITIKVNNNVTRINKKYGKTLKVQIEAYLNDIVSAHLTELHNMPIVFDCSIDNVLKLPTQVDYFVEFNYAHGLKQSSSYGCQNIVHGHHSYIGIELETRYNALVDFNLLLENIKEYYHNKLFINQNDIQNDNGNVVQSYESVNRGEFEIQFSESFAIDNVVYFDTDTTVENIIHAVKRDFGEALKQHGVKRLYVSEGLAKGAVEQL